MNKKVLALSVVTIFSLNLYSNEPSAFGAGDLDNPQPYGLSSSEKVVLENKTEIQKVVTKTKNQSFKIEAMNERIDGLRSVLENLTRSSHQNQIDLQHLKEKNSEYLANSDEFEKRLSDISQKNSEDIQQINLVLQNLNELVSKIELSFVTKDEFNTLVSDFNSFKKVLKEEFKSETVKKVSKKEKRTNWKISKDAQTNFDKKHYIKSIRDYEYLVKQNFKPAYSTYMIGEMQYKQKNYAEAIAYFKKSAKLYSKAEYMPNLMLHTAMAMEATGDVKNAKIFYNAIASSYPDSKEASIALKNLETLQ